MHCTKKHKSNGTRMHAESHLSAVAVLSLSELRGESSAQRRHNLTAPANLASPPPSPPSQPANISFPPLMDEGMVTYIITAASHTVYIYIYIYKALRSKHMLVKHTLTAAEGERDMSCS